jgi:hypothetical protein
LVGLALCQGDISDEGVPDAITILFYDYDALVSPVYAEIMPVRIIEEVVQLKQTKFLVEFLETFAQDGDLLALEFTLFDDAVHLEVFLLVL